MSTACFTTFQLDEQLFGLDIRYIREINKQLELSPVPHAPEYISGLINLRGQIVTIMDLKKRLGFGSTERTHETHNLIIKTDQERLNLHTLHSSEDDELSVADKVGLLVDQIGEVVTVPAAEVEGAPANVGKLDGKYISGVVKLHGNLVTILNLQKILMAE